MSAPITLIPAAAELSAQAVDKLTKSEANLLSAFRGLPPDDKDFLIRFAILRATNAHNSRPALRLFAGGAS
jgi:hypothetical protein